MAARAKFKVTTITQHEQNDPPAFNATVQLQAVNNEDGDNKDCSHWPPSGKAEITITNLTAISPFELGQAYFLDFTPAT